MISQEKDTYFVAVKVFLEKDGKFLIMKDNFGDWDLPGGRIKKDEFEAPLEKIIARKMSQEIGVDVRYEIGKPLLFLRHERIEASPGNPTVRIFAVGYPATWKEGEIKLSERHTELLWVDPKTFKPEDYFKGGWLKGVQDYISMLSNKEKVENIAFIDGQNLYMGTAKREIDPWEVNLSRFRVYLKEKYHVDKAYYFLGYVQETNQELYEEIQNAGFVLIFREHNPAMIGKKKGNVDSDIIFHIMKKMYKKEDFKKIVLVSGDGDYKLVVDFLIEEKRFEKILFPDRNRASSLYKKIGAAYFDALDMVSVRNKIARNWKMKKAP